VIGAAGRMGTTVCAAVEYALQASVHTGNSIVNSDLSFSHQTATLLQIYWGFGVNF